MWRPLRCLNEYKRSFWTTGVDSPAYCGLDDAERPIDHEKASPCSRLGCLMEERLGVRRRWSR